MAQEGEWVADTTKGVFSLFFFAKSGRSGFPKK